VLSLFGGAGNTSFLSDAVFEKPRQKVVRISKLNILREQPMSDVGKTVTRYELYDAVYQKVGLSRTESSAFVELVLDEM